MRFIQKEFNKNVVVTIFAISNIVWGLAKIHIWEMSDNPNLIPLATTLEKSCNYLRDTLKKLGVSTDAFDEFDVRMATRKNPNN